MGISAVDCLGRTVFFQMVGCPRRVSSPSCKSSWTRVALWRISIAAGKCTTCSRETLNIRKIAAGIRREAVFLRFEMGVSHLGQDTVRRFCIVALFNDRLNAANLCEGLQRRSVHTASCVSLICFVSFGLESGLPLLDESSFPRSCAEPPHPVRGLRSYGGCDIPCMKSHMATLNAIC